MGQIFRIAVLVSVFLIAAAGCSWTRGLFSGTKQAAGDQGSQAEGITANSSDSQQPLPGQGNGKVRGSLETVQVLFGVGRSDLNKSAQAHLQTVIEKIKQNPKLSLALEGYADSVGAADYNLRLIQKRVEAVRRYLVDKGVEPTRIQSATIGQLPDAGTPNERAKNRRVTVKLMPASD